MMAGAPGALGSEVIFNTAETLVTYAPDATEPSPLLAASMPDVSTDGLTYTFILRAGVKFSDGTPLNAAAVKFSLERAKAFGDKDPEAAGSLLDAGSLVDAEPERRSPGRPVLRSRRAGRTRRVSSP